MTHEPGDACCTPSATSWAPSRSDSAPAQPQPSPAAGARRAPPPTTTEDLSNGMVELAGGPFLMGAASEGEPDFDGEGPVREVTIEPFAIDAQAVTNAQFAAFIKATGYQTEAERFGWSFVFRRHLSRQTARRLEKTNAVVQAPWWIAVPGARWDLPEGPGRDLRGREQHPVVHVSWSDAPPIASGPVSACPRKRSGSTPPGEAWSRRSTPGGTSSRPVESTAATSGRAPSPTTTRAAMVSPRPPRSTASSRTASGSTTARATSGSGPPTGSARTTTGRKRRRRG